MKLAIFTSSFLGYFVFILLNMEYLYLWCNVLSNLFKILSDTNSAEFVDLFRHALEALIFVLSVFVNDYIATQR